MWGARSAARVQRLGFIPEGFRLFAAVRVEGLAFLAGSFLCGLLFKIKVLFWVVAYIIRHSYNKDLKGTPV